MNINDHWDSCAIHTGAGECTCLADEALPGNLVFVPSQPDLKEITRFEHMRGFCDGLLMGCFVASLFWLAFGFVVIQSWRI